MAWSTTTTMTRSPQVPCMFIFGDSLVDNGNNDQLLTISRANYPPYGIDFAQGSSGRFSNGRTLADVLTQLLGFRDFIPSYALAQSSSILRGLNYASGASGIRDETGNNLNLYNMGARKFAIIGVGQIGCIPYELARMNNRNEKNRCNEEINRAISIYNNGLIKMVDRFNNGELPGANFVYVNTYESSKDVAGNATSYGFEMLDKGCCGVGRNNGQITCLPFQQPCPDQSKYLFWDAFHPTEAANVIYARKAYGSTDCSEVYPMNIKQLASCV
ncbi:GDSL esterase/lipase [Acorus calamus]|uniref:GDSL esterase/lipase n=1 Tax=Acorus calamus TaxID=4465 RepID=A0AAV9DF65_ACOCL|nr:GDSL esterase/lipase [Acorus calamus]